MHKGLGLVSLSRSVVANELGQVKNLLVKVNGSSPSTQTHWHEHLQLNSSHPDITVNFIQQMEFDDQLDVRQRYSWVTQLEFPA